MKIYIVTTESPVGYVGTRASKEEAVALIRSKYPNAIEVGNMTYTAKGTIIAVYEDELPIPEDTKQEEIL